MTRTGALSNPTAVIRFWPDKVKGEGFFLACVRKTGGEENSSLKTKNKAEPATKKETDILQKWVKAGGRYFIKYKNTAYAWPQGMVDDFNLLLTNLRVIYSGTIIGEFFHDKMVPDHALAMSNFVNELVEKTTALNYDQAIEYLKRKDLRIETQKKGWQLVRYEGNSLGWINALPNRINNYYPKELRILKDL